MLDPSVRRVLLEALRPPDGYRVDEAIATTYSLDLLALLMAPLSFSLFDAIADRDEAPQLDSFALLHAVRDHAARLTAYCQAGCIARPPKYRPLLGYLESSVVQVGARDREKGVFHPKMWVLRFVPLQAAPVLYRAIVSSRNLTFDRCWDTMLVLEGELVDRKNDIAESKSLGDFVASLPSLAIDDVSDRVRAQADRVGRELRRVRWEVPEPFEQIRFWPMGHDGKQARPFDRIDRSLVISPFLSPDLLAELSGVGGGHALVSRVDELERLGRKDLAAFSKRTFVVEEGADGDEEDVDDATGPGKRSLRGLHAKLFVIDSGWDAHVYTGSANATHAAFWKNVELLVQLTGKKSAVGVEKVLSSDGGFGKLLRPFAPAETPAGPSAQESLDDELDAIAHRLACSAWRLHAAREESGTYRMELHAPQVPNGGASVHVWPITLAQDFAQPLTQTIAFVGRSVDALTPFFAFELVLSREGVTSRKTFVLTVPGNLDELGIDRGALLLQSLLDEPAKVRRFLQLLLSLDVLQGLEVLETELAAESSGTGMAAQETDAPLLESMLRALDRQPEKLASIARLVEELKKLPNGAGLLPAGFESVWGPIAEAHARRATS